MQHPLHHIAPPRHHGSRKRYVLEPADEQLLQSFIGYLDVLSFSEGTQQSYESSIREFLYVIREWGVVSFSDFNQALAEQFMTYISMRPNHRKGGGVSAGHYNKIRGAVVAFFSYLKSQGAIKPKLAHMPKDYKRPVILTPSQAQKLFDVWDRTPLGIRNRAILAAAYGAGLRKGEIYHLNVDSIDLERKLLHVAPSKNGKGRYVPLSTACAKYFEDYLSGIRDFFVPYAGSTAEPALFLSNRCKRLSKPSLVFVMRSSVAKTFDPFIINKAPNLHALRHSVATALYYASGDLDFVRDFLGHGSIDTTSIYVSLSKEMELEIQQGQ